MASLTVYMILKGSLRRKQSSKKQDFLLCPETVLAMPYSPHCFSTPPSPPPAGHPHPSQQDPREASRHSGCSAWRDLRPFSSPPCQARLGQTKHLAREERSLLILASGSPPRQQQQLNRYGKLGSTEVRAGSRCLQTAHAATCCQLNINWWWAGGEPRWLGLRQILPPSSRDGGRKNCSS